MAVFYTKAEACDIMLQGTAEESLARILSEQEGRGYYLITAYTGYAGEEMESYLSCCDRKDIYEHADELVYLCASEWIDQHLSTWEEDGYGSREDAAEDYYAGCGYTVTPIHQNEYAKASDGYWVMKGQTIDG